MLKLQTRQAKKKSEKVLLLLMFILLYFPSTNLTFTSSLISIFIQVLFRFS